jgi:hypothetical protein
MIHAAPTAIAVIATAALAASFACFAASRISGLMSSTTRSTAVFMHSAANTKIPPATKIDVSAALNGNHMARGDETQFATIHCLRLGSVFQTCAHPCHDHMHRFTKRSYCVIKNFIHIILIEYVCAAVYVKPTVMPRLQDWNTNERVDFIAADISVDIGVIHTWTGAIFSRTPYLGKA